MTRTSGIDFSRFQFDRDLSMAAFFLNADGTIYGRYGTRSGRDDDGVTAAGFEKAAEAALRVHAEYAADPASMKGLLEGKTGAALPWKSANEIPALKGWRQGGAREGNRCIHCHNFQTSSLESLYTEGRPLSDAWIWPFPMPDLLGLALDPRERATVAAVLPGTEAERAGLRIGDEIVRAGGQPILSIADMQWVLHQAKDPCRLDLEILRDGKSLQAALALPAGWRRAGSFSWRVSMAGMKEKLLGFSAEELPAAERKRLGLEEGNLALKVVRFFGQRARAAGIQKGDVVLEIDGNRKAMTEGDLLAYLLLEKRPGDLLRLTILRDGKTLSVGFAVGPGEDSEKKKR